MYLYALLKVDYSRGVHPIDRYIGMYKKVFVRYTDAIAELSKMPKKIRRTFIIQRWAYYGDNNIPPTVYHAVLYESNGIDGEKKLHYCSSNLYDNHDRLRFEDKVWDCGENAYLVKIPKSGMNKYTYINPFNTGIFYHIRIRRYTVVGYTHPKKWTS